MRMKVVMSRSAVPAQDYAGGRASVPFLLIFRLQKFNRLHGYFQMASGELLIIIIYTYLTYTVCMPYVLV